MCVCVYIYIYIYIYICIHPLLWSLPPTLPSHPSKVITESTDYYFVSCEERKSPKTIKFNLKMPNCKTHSSFREVEMCILEPMTEEL